MITIHLDLPLDESTARGLRAGDMVTLSGSILSGRDAAQKRLIDLIDKGEDLPIPLEGETIYYVGPAPASPGHAVGSAGPTTSFRMDAYTPKLLARGLRATIGKGLRNAEGVDARKTYGAVYFGAVGGAAALISRSILSSEVIAYPDLGPEAIHRFVIKDFPVIVLIDSLGNNLYESGPNLYKQTDL